MWLNSQETADLVTFTEEILNGKLHFLCSVLYLLSSSRKSQKDRKKESIWMTAEKMRKGKRKIERKEIGDAKGRQTSVWNARNSTLGEIYLSFFNRKQHSPMLFSILTRFSCIVFFILTKTDKLLIFLKTHLDYGESNQAKDLEQHLNIFLVKNCV